MFFALTVITCTTLMCIICMCIAIHSDLREARADGRNVLSNREAFTGKGK